MRPREDDCGCVYTDERTGMCAEHFLALLDAAGDDDR